MKLESARKIVDAALIKARELDLNPMSVVVLDARGALRGVLTEDDASQQRAEIAFGKANGAIAFGMGTRGLAKRAEKNPAFMAAAAEAIRGPLIPVTGGVLVRDKDGNLLGAGGLSGDKADADEACAVAGIEAAGLIAQVDE